MFPARQPVDHSPALTSDGDVRTVVAQSVLDLTHQVFSASTLVQGVTPTLEYLVARTAAVGAAYIQVTGAQDQGYRVRATWGQVPRTPSVQDIVFQGLPLRTPMMRALEVSPGPLFFDDTTTPCETLGFRDVGIASLAAAPVRAQDDELLGAFLMYTSTPHVWTKEEAAVFSLVAGTIAGLAGRLAADEQASAAREAALRAMGLALEVRDGETKGHTDRVTALALRLARALCWSPSQTRALRWGAYLHDIGKIAIPDAVLLKRGPLDGAEWQVMRSHAGEGVRFAKALGFLPQTALDVVTDHHERWDGQGYPAGKAGQAISLAGRLFALCDVYDALTSERPYKVAWTSQAALAEIEAQAGRHFDPELTRLFLQVMGQDQSAAH
ncbi:HD-GYP domain-containing protein [Deinococcus radiopugnans]|uniref:Nucleotidyltransferase with HDIG domain n=2 Tax=Deinococcus radiopugnans ATCC 19172 TaxID=585398 RepID=A0ABR6NM81_9DEIO|nr:HD-GYP domain-containing protein [Deinococcus radiopugnans]MBB6015147.1 putative nucleotidyltransferase with HDIG domain [Deinococcus radiopugnans ATCC 19172]